MRTLSAIMSILFIGATASAAMSNGGRGGGDLCEDRIQVVRDDIKSWITAGGSQSLQLPAGISLERYNQQMLQAIGTAKIRCVKNGDSGYPVQIDGTPKVCRFDGNQKKGRITCDYKSFMDQQVVSDSDQYVYVHHELAGLAALESPQGDISSYELSNQISGYLVDEVVKKLAIKPVAVASAVQSSLLFNRYADLHELFRKAQSIDPARLNAAYAGRCLLAPAAANSQEKIVAGLLVGEMVAVPNNAGPLLADGAQLIVKIITGSDSSVNDHSEFDFISTSQASAFWASAANQSTPVQAVGGGSPTWNSVSAQDDTISYQARLTGSYVLIHAQRRTEAVMDCYFFNGLK